MTIDVKKRRWHDPDKKFDLERGREYFGDLVVPFDRSLDFPIVGFNTKFSDDPRVASSVNLRLYIPSHVNRIVDEDVIPSIENSFFKLFYTYGHGQGEEVDYSFSFSSWAYPKEHKARDYVDIQMRSLNKVPNFCIVAPDKLIENVVKVAPLPIEKSDCGVSLGFPELNKLGPGKRAWHSFSSDYKLIER